MEAFSELLDQLYFTNSTKTKARLLQAYLRNTPDPDRGWAIAAIAGTLSFDFFKRNTVKQLIIEHSDPTLFALSYDYVGEMSETVAHLWPGKSVASKPLPGLSETIALFQSAKKKDVPVLLADLLDQMTPSQRWALIKLGTRGLRIGMSARSLKHALAEYGNVDIAELEAIWHGLEPPYTNLMSWLEGKSDKPDVSDKVTFYPVMLSHPLDESTLKHFAVEDWQVEWKFDGIRVQLVNTEQGKALFSRTGDDISSAFPDLLQAIDFNGRLDGELVVMHDQNIASFNDLQQRLNKKKPSKNLMERFPAHLIVYDALSLQGKLLVDKTLNERRSHLEQWFSQTRYSRMHLSEIVESTSTEQWQLLRKEATSKGTIEGLMLKKKASTYISGRPSGQWYKWKRDPRYVDAVMMYAQRGHGKRSSFYSDYTFGAWDGDNLLPIGKAYSGFTDEELKKLDSWVRRHTIGRFGPVKEVEKALVLEIAFDSIHPSNRHKSGVAMRFPRIHRIRWDKPACEADTLEQVKTYIE